MSRKSGGLSFIERFLSLFTKMGPGEGVAVLLFASYAFLLLVCYYILKTTREVFILTEHGAETASYAIAAQALAACSSCRSTGCCSGRRRRPS